MRAGEFSQEGEPVVLRDRESALRFAQALAKQGLTISAFLLATNFNAEDREREIRWVTEVVCLAEALEVRAVRIDAVMRGERELSLTERVSRFAEGVKEVLANTPNSQVGLGIENHGLQGNDPDFLESLFAAVGSPRLGMTLDTGNFYWAGHPLSKVYAILERLAPLTKHTHVKNIRYPEETREQQRQLGWKYGEYVCPIYEGDIDHFRVVRYLRQAGYQGDLCVEDESLGHYSEEERKKVLARDVEHLKEALAAA